MDRWQALVLVKEWQHLSWGKAVLLGSERGLAKVKFN